MHTRTGFWVATAAATMALGFSGSALADRHGRHGHHHQHQHHQHHHQHQRHVVVTHEYARVLDVDPIISRVRVSNPARECWNETQTVYTNPRSSTPRSTLVGGLIGGAVGHRIGHRAGLGHDPMAVVAGGLIGAAIGHDIGERRDERNGNYAVPVERSVERCNVSYHDSWEERIDGYRVTYIYHGRTYTTRMPYDPGPTVRMNDDLSSGWNGR
jgi:uncharacterized protein YcfJ